MSWFEAEIAALRKAAGAATCVAEQAEAIDLGATVDTITDGLPGSRAAGATSELAQAWTERMKDWSSDTRTYGTQVASCANDFEADEEAAAAGFRGIAPPNWPPTWR